MFSGAKDRTILTAVSRPGLSLGTLGGTLPQPALPPPPSPTQASSSPSSLSPRILSVPPPADAQDDAFSFRPVINQLHVEPQHTRVPAVDTVPAVPQQLPARTKSTILLRDDSQGVDDVSLQTLDDNLDAGTDAGEEEEEGVPLSSVIPAIISAMEESASPARQSSLLSLLEDVVTIQTSAQPQRQQRPRQQKQANTAPKIQGR